jgi:putative transposase
MYRRRPTRVPGFSYIGIHRYHVRTSTYQQLRLFTRDDYVAAARTQFQRTSDEEKFSILAYCFMPDHVHLALEGRAPTSDFRRFVKLAKQRSTFALQTQFEVNKVWQDGYFDRVLRYDEAVDVLVRYILENPVRAGLVARAEDYPYSGALYWPEPC